MEGRELEPKVINQASIETRLEDYDVRINFLSRGCIVRVGCKSIAFEDNDEMIAVLSEYVNDPTKISKKWREILK